MMTDMTDITIAIKQQITFWVSNIILTLDHDLFTLDPDLLTLNPDPLYILTVNFMQPV